MPIIVLIPYRPYAFGTGYPDPGRLHRQIDDFADQYLPVWPSFIIGTGAEIYSEQLLTYAFYLLLYFIQAGCLFFS